MSYWAQECVSQRLVNTQRMLACYSCRLLVERELPLKGPGSVSQEHFQEMNLAREEEESSAADASV